MLHSILKHIQFLFINFDFLFDITYLIILDEEQK